MQQKNVFEAKVFVGLYSAVHTAYSASYDPTLSDYIIYYQDGENRSEDIGIYHEEEDTFPSGYTFDSGCYASYDTVECRKGNIYWVLQDNPTGAFQDKNNLLIYNCEAGTVDQYPQGFSCTLNDYSFHYLTFNGDNALRIDLYECLYA